MKTRERSQAKRTSAPLFLPGSGPKTEAPGLSIPLKSSIFSATGSPLAGLNDSLGGLLKFDGLLGDKSSAWTGLLDKAREGVAPAQLQDKLPLKDKLPIPGGLKDLGLPF